MPASALLDEIGSTRLGLTETEAARRRALHGANVFETGRENRALGLLLRQLRSPLTLILVIAIVVANAVGEWLNAGIILAILLLSSVLSGLQEFHAGRAVEKLRARLELRCSVQRDARLSTRPASELVPGDIVVLSAGSLIPADAVLLESRDLFVTQALLTGETLPAEKYVGVSPTNATLAERANCLYTGTSVRSGTATALVVQTGRDTAFGRIVDRLAADPGETEFERGLRRFGALLIRTMLVVVVVVLSVNLLLHRPLGDTLLFAMALAVGISPELLPAILSITLAHGAQAMANRGVIVRRLNAIENLGSMDILCTDKTGTLTEARMTLERIEPPVGDSSPAALEAAYANAVLQTGITNPLDDAIVSEGERAGLSPDLFTKVDEIPYDFLRKRLTIAVRYRNRPETRLVTKGALAQVLAICNRYASDSGVQALDTAMRDALTARFARWGQQGYRVLGLARRDVAARASYGRDDECAMVFEGFLLFLDPPREDAPAALAALTRQGVQVKIISGDNEHVTAHLAGCVGLAGTRVLTGAELARMRDEALWHAAPQISVFAEIEPNQKERIIRALQRTGHVVGYLGDGINDAPALQAADIGISIDRAADVAREAADFVLLRHDLGVLSAGIDEGRRTFANTLKYVYVTTSANFGNMCSLALASLVLPFLPLLATQVLLNNFLSSVPALGIAGDTIDAEWRDTPHRWNRSLIRAFMVTFGGVSSLFDMLTFGVLLVVFESGAALFRTGWFVESVLTQICIILIVRTRGAFYRSRPGTFLIATSIIVALMTLGLPYVGPVARAFSFVALPVPVLGAMIAISLVYLIVSEATKRYFFDRFGAS